MLTSWDSMISCLDVSCSSAKQDVSTDYFVESVRCPGLVDLERPADTDITAFQLRGGCGLILGYHHVVSYLLKVCQLLGKAFLLLGSPSTEFCGSLVVCHPADGSHQVLPCHLLLSVDVQSTETNTSRYPLVFNFLGLFTIASRPLYTLLFL